MSAITSRQCSYAYCVCSRCSDWLKSCSNLWFWICFCFCSFWQIKIVNEFDDSESKSIVLMEMSIKFSHKSYLYLYRNYLIAIYDARYWRIICRYKDKYTLSSSCNIQVKHKMNKWISIMADGTKFPLPCALRYLRMQRMVKCSTMIIWVVRHASRERIQQQCMLVIKHKNIEKKRERDMCMWAIVIFMMHIKIPMLMFTNYISFVHLGIVILWYFHFGSQTLLIAKSERWNWIHVMFWIIIAIDFIKM